MLRATIFYQSIYFQIPSRQRRQFRDKALPDYGEEDEPEPLQSLVSPEEVEKSLKEDKPKTKKSVHLAPIASEKELSRVGTTSSFVQPQDDEEGGTKVESWDSKVTYILGTYIIDHYILLTF